MLLGKLIKIFQNDPQVINEGREFNPFSLIIGDGFSAVILLLISIFFIYLVVTILLPQKSHRGR